MDENSASGRPGLHTGRGARRCFVPGRRVLAQALSTASVVLGIGLICWSLVNIGTRPVAATQARPGPSSTTPTATTGPTQTVGPVPVRASGGAEQPAARPRAVDYAKNPSKGETLGTLSLPSLEQDVLIIEGTRTSDLKKGAGHYTKSVLPGEKDNCVLSAHRDTFFSRLGELEKGDRVIVETATGTYEYVVKATRIVGKDDRTVIVPKDHGVLTLTTCYPFNYVGNAPKRYIVSADLVEAAQ